MEKKLCISLIFSNFVVSKHKVIIFHAMHNLYVSVSAFIPCIIQKKQ